MKVINKCLLAAFMGFWSVWLFNNINPWIGITVISGYVYYEVKKLVKEEK